MPSNADISPAERYDARLSAYMKRRFITDQPAWAQFVGSSTNDEPRPAAMRPILSHRPRLRALFAVSYMSESETSSSKPSIASASSLSSPSTASSWVIVSGVTSPIEALPATYAFLPCLRISTLIAAKSCAVVIDWLSHWPNSRRT